MPHSEYPLGSACLCEAWANMMDDLFGPLANYENVAFNPGNLITLDRLYPQGTSFFEPRRTPASDVLLSYSDWSSISQACGQSCLNGGMHFTNSVPAGAALCSNVGIKTVSYYKGLENGNTPSIAIDLSTLKVKESRNCPPEPPATCGLEWQACTTNSTSCCPDYYCEYVNDFYLHCRTDLAAKCIAEHRECTNSGTDCCYGTSCVGNQYYRKCTQD